MKKLPFIALFALVASFSYSQDMGSPIPLSKSEVNVDLAVFAWDSQSHDFGKVKQGIPVTHEFKFTNAGNVPLLIINAQPSCGCTTPDWTKVPVPPGGSGFIKATFNAASPGAFDKTITVTANVENGTVPLKIKGEVVVVAQ